MVSSLRQPFSSFLRFKQAMDRSRFSTWDSVRHIWGTLGLPGEALERLELQGGDDVASPSSFKIGHFAQSSIAASGLSAAVYHAYRNAFPIPRVIVDRQHAVVEFQTEKLYLLNGEASHPPWGSIGGLHKASDGYVRVHDSFPHHRNAALKMVGCAPDASKADFADKLRLRRAGDLENDAASSGAIIFAMRSYEQWDDTPQGRMIKDFPITVTKVADSPPHFATQSAKRSNKSLTGIRVVELSRVIAAPVAGKALAAHGADVLWVTSPNLPDLPDLDRDVGRGKRTIQLDLNESKDCETLRHLVRDADVFLQSYRPGSLAKRGFSIEHHLSGRDRPLVCANLPAWGTDGPWSNRRGFDSIVQTASGMNDSEAKHYGDGSQAKPLPCQALDHGSGYLLATGIITALYRQATEGGSYQVDVSLAEASKYLRSLGQYGDKTCFECKGYEKFEDVPAAFMETKECAFGQLQAVKHSVQIEGVDVGWEHMPKPLGSDEPVWLPV